MTARRHPMRVLATDGLDYLSDLNRADAGMVGTHWNAVRRYLESGDSNDLDQFAGVTITGVDQAGVRRHVRLETDLDAIDAHAIRGDVRFESIYDEVQ